MNEMDLRKTMLDLVAKLEVKGFNHGSSGNVSCRIGDDMLVTPTGGNSSNMAVEQLVRLDRNGDNVGNGIPSSEWHMHQAILQAYPHVQAIIHTHADCCVALSCLARPIPAFHYMIASFGGTDVPCAPYATFGTKALADGAVAALKDRKACLLANHGMIVAAASLQQAFDLTVKLETLARQYILARQAGEPAIIPDDEIVRVLERYKGYGRSRLPG
ncbi:class II aldolase/adducin family protein [Rhizobium sp. CFBP 13726]|uniref:class II aldolase/adducin family protein n=1 Tax=Rhizobium sp. CFBP 13726 TaxID=2775296 RepID=UPI001783E748|nr:class II aldolase/adducin family protein [Rhizobium sp. CFBP 13726]MBD8652873.1 class II aldolase/adducin family protein [Rhizobium sp. CFBP 13726]